MEHRELIELVTRAQTGDSGAMEALFAAYYNDVYYFALKTVKDSETACDITQETFLEIIRTIGELKEPAAFVVWMKRIAYHQCTRYFKKKREVTVEEDEDGNTIFDTLADEREGSIPAEVCEQEEFRAAILGIINELSEAQRAAVLLYYFDELSVGQIAGIQGVSEGTVKSRLNYARKSIKKSVEEYEKKHNVKLHSVSFLPLLLFFGRELMPADKAEAVRHTVQKAAAAWGGAAGTAAAGGAAVKTVGVSLAAKITAGIVAVAVLVGAAALVLQPEGCRDLDGDCACDDCGAEVHHFDRAVDHAQCFQCGGRFFNHDLDADYRCDICGEPPCGTAHQQPHAYADGICAWCGAGEQAALPEPEAEHIWQDGVCLHCGDDSRATGPVFEVAGHDVIITGQVTGAEYYELRIDGEVTGRFDPETLTISLEQRGLEPGTGYTLDVRAFCPDAADLIGSQPVTVVY